MWSFAYFFFLLSTYYMLLPLRDAMGSEGGTRGLQVAVRRHVRRDVDHRAVPGLGAGGKPAARACSCLWCTLFLVVNMLVFWFLMRAGVSPVGVARAFFIWITVFSVFTVSVFWTFMADLYSSEQSKRLFGFIGAGGSIGSILGPLITKHLVEPIGVANLLLDCQHASNT